MESKNSMLNDVRALYDSIFLDLVNLHPSIRTSLERDKFRLTSQSESCGLPLFTIALPTAGKWFDKSLSTGYLIEPRPPHFGVKGKGDKRPVLFHGLVSLIFEADGTLMPLPDISAVVSMRQLLLAAKKLRMECEKVYTDETIRTFHEIERSLPAPWDETWNDNNPRWSLRAGHPIWGASGERDCQASLFDTPNPLLQLDFDPDWEGFRRFSARILSQFGPFDPAGVRHKHGPGAVSDRERGYNKYDHKYWTERLDTVFPYDWHANSSLGISEYVDYREFASKMCAVPKTQSGPRLIASEPTAHQWAQQGIRGYLEDGVQQSALRGIIHFRSQEPSRVAALNASYTGKLATVDLSSASDRLTCRLVEYMFQVNRPLLDGMAACRSRAMVSLTGELLLLRKFAGQGSSLTFPVQSICYAILAMWSVAITRRLGSFHAIVKACSDVRVFGDDIIVPVDAYPVLAGLLKTCLLKVNSSKTHDSGFFRESCGMDAFMGHDVTPAYFREPYSAKPESLASVVEVSNNFHRKGYWHTASWLISTVEPEVRKHLPVGEGFGAVSVFSFCGSSTDHLKLRWNRRYHVWEVLTADLSVKLDRTDGHGEGRLLQYFTERLTEFPTAGDLDEPGGQDILDVLRPSEYSGGQAGRPQFRVKLRWVAIPNGFAVEA